MQKSNIFLIVANGSDNHRRIDYGNYSYIAGVSLMFLVFYRKAFRCISKGIVARPPAVKFNNYKMSQKIVYLLYLSAGIIAETIATTCLIYTKEFTRFWPSAGVIILYIIGLFFLTLSIRIIPVGIAYAIWAGLGIILVAILSFLLHKQKLDSYAIAGIILIIAGVIIINLFSKSIKH